MLAVESESMLTRITVVTQVEESGAALTNAIAATIMVAFVLKWKQDTVLSPSIMTANFTAAIPVSKTT